MVWKAYARSRGNVRRSETRLGENRAFHRTNHNASAIVRVEMPIPYDDAHRIFASEKRLLKPLRWESVAKNNDKTVLLRRLEARVQIDAGVPRGVFFRLMVHPGSLTNVTFQLDCDHSTGRTNIALYRFELNPIRPHSNKLYGPDEINGAFIGAGVPHEHLFYDSLCSDGSLRRRTDQQARIVEDPPEDFPTALEFVCRRINITNGTDVPNPGGQGLLL